MNANALVVFALAISAVQLGCAAPADKSNCSNMDAALEDLGGAQGITTLNDKYKLSSTEAEFVARCAEMTDAIKSLKRYNKDCYSSLTQQVFSAILRTRGAMTEASCKQGSDEFKAALGASKCIKEHAFEAVKEAEKKTILASQNILDANVHDNELRLRRSCCAVLAAKDYFLDAAKPKCGQFEKVYVNYVDSYTSEAFGLLCKEADKLKCDQLEPLKSAMSAEPSSKFFLSPMLKLVKTMDNN